MALNRRQMQRIVWISTILPALHRFKSMAPTARSSDPRNRDELEIVHEANKSPRVVIALLLVLPVIGYVIEQTVRSFVIRDICVVLAWLIYFGVACYLESYPLAFMLIGMVFLPALPAVTDPPGAYPSGIIFTGGLFGFMFGIVVARLSETWLNHIKRRQNRATIHKHENVASVMPTTDN